MIAKATLWLLLIGLSLLNIRLVSLRWSEPIMPLSTPDIAYPLFHGFAGGVLAYALILGVWEHLREKRWLTAPLVTGIGLTLGYTLYERMNAQLPFLQSSKEIWFGAGVFAAILGLTPARGPKGASNKFSVSLTPWFFFVSFNLLLLFVPMSPLSPTIEQTPPNAPPAQDINFGSIHAELAPPYVYARGLVNSLFPAPSINSTAIVSAGFVSLAIALTASAVNVAFGSPWGWGVVLLALTDRWVLASGIAAAIVSMPMVSASLALLLAMWAMYRPRGALRFKESLLVGLVGGVGTLFTIFGYAAGRIPWILGGAFIGATLLFRRAIPIKIRSLGTLSLLLAPSVLVIAFVVQTLFSGSLIGFKEKIFITPPPVLIGHPSDYPGIAVPFRNPDTVMWWGTARIESRNMTIQWLRSPSELLEEVIWMVKNISIEAPIDRSTMMLAFAGILLGLLTPLPLRRGGVLCVVVLTLCGTLPYLVGEDPTAFRRGAFASLGISALVTTLFAHLGRPRWRFMTFGLLCALCALRAPLEVLPLLTSKMTAPICARCPAEFNIRNLTLDPLFETVTDRNLFFPSPSTDGGQGVRCQTLAIDTYEFKRMAPHATQGVVPGDNYAEALNLVKPNDIVVARCKPDTAPRNPLCTGAIPGANFIGTVPRNVKDASTWWALHEKL